MDLKPKRSSIEFANFKREVDTDNRICIIESCHPAQFDTSAIALQFKFENWGEIQAILEHFGHQIPGVNRK